MSPFISLLIVVATLLLALTSGIHASVKMDGPITSKTPGKLCTPSDPNYSGQAYGIAKCARNVGSSEKASIAKAYGLLSSEYSQVEFDHLIPLGIGGSDDITNVWPQPGPTGQGQSGSKDKVEQQAYNLLSGGSINQYAAVKMITDWLNQNYNTNYSPEMYGLSSNGMGLLARRR